MRTLVWFTGGAAAACVCVVLLARSAPLPALIALAVLGLALALVRLVFRTRSGRAAGWMLLGLCVGLIWCGLYGALYLRPLNSLPDTPQTVTLRALEAPTRANFGYALSVRVTLDGRQMEGVLYYDSADQTPQPGDSVTCTASLRRTDAHDDLYARARGTLLRLSTDEITVTPCKRVPLRSLPARLSARLQALCTKLFPADVRGLLCALLTGVRSGLSETDTAALRQAGVYHAVAISGMHVSILVWLISCLSRSRKRTAALGIPVIVLFVLMTGASPSAVRAGLMQVLLLLAPLLAREYDASTSLAASLLAILAQNPWSIASISLQLSFAAVLGLLLFSGQLTRWMQSTCLYARCARKKPIRALADALVLSLACSFATSVFTMPLCAYYFGLCSLIAPLSNLLILWAVTVLFAGGIVTCVLGLVCVPLARGLGSVLAVPARYVLRMAGLLSRPAYAAVSAAEPCWIIFTALFVLALGLVCCVPAVRRWRSAAALAVAFAVCAASGALAERLPAFSCTMLDVGQGQCIIYQAQTACAIIDCGGSGTPAPGELAARTLLGRGQRRVDALILTHYDEDHIGGVPELFRTLHIETLYLPDIPDDTDARSTLCALADASGTQIVWVDAPRRVSLGTATLQLLLPAGTQTGDNSGICVLASAAEYDILVTGDLPLDAERTLLTRYDLPQVELLVAGHHGAASSTGYGLLGCTRPDTVLISVGADNPYGHPAEQTLHRIRAIGAQILRTDQCGTITIRR